LNAFGFHLTHTPVDQTLFHLEIGNAVTQQTANAVILLEQSDAMACARELLRTGEAGRTRSDHSYALSGRNRREIGMNPALFPAAVDDLTFNGFDRHGIVVDVQCARGLAWRGTDAAGELRKIIGGMQRFKRIPPLIAI